MLYPRSSNLPLADSKSSCEGILEISYSIQKSFSFPKRFWLSATSTIIHLMSSSKSSILLLKFSYSFKYFIDYILKSKPKLLAWVGPEMLSLEGYFIFYFERSLIKSSVMIEIIFLPSTVIRGIFFTIEYLSFPSTCIDSIRLHTLVSFEYFLM